MSCHHFLFTILFSISANALCLAKAVVPEKPILDESVIECVYDHRIRDYDVGRERNRSEILQIGNKYVQFGSYNSYIVDSILVCYRPEEITYQTYSDLKKIYGVVQENAFLIDRKNKLLSYGEQIIFTGPMCYVAPLTKMKWTLED